jgi:integrase
MGAFWADLQSRHGTSVLALQFTILTAVRTNDATGAKWIEVDDQERVWSIPGDRMKRDRDHRVPLSKAAVQVLGRAKELRDNEYVFPGTGRSRRLSNGAFDALLENMGYRDKEGRPITTHGFRSTFKDWARDCTNFDREISEAALAHAIGDETEAAYARGDMLEKRRRLMDAWAQFCASGKVDGKVIPIRRGELRL